MSDDLPSTWIHDFCLKGAKVSRSEREEGSVDVYDEEKLSHLSVVLLVKEQARQLAVSNLFTKT